MTRIENYINIAKRKGYNKMPPNISLCPSLRKRFEEYCHRTGLEYRPSHIGVPDLIPSYASSSDFLRYYNHTFKEGTTIDKWGIAHEPGSKYAFHMTKMYHPMKDFDSVEQVLAYPFPDYKNTDDTAQREFVKKAHAQDTVAVGSMQITIWERAWYLRGMENLMVDMMTEDPLAEALLDIITDIAVTRAESFAKSGVDVLFLGDDIGMQKSIMMSEELYCTWLKPRLARVIAQAKTINPDLIVFYHSCGFVTPMIPHLIEAGIDVLNPVQPECMDFAQIHKEFGDRLSFHGTIGTQTTMPFGTPDDVRKTVFKNLEIAGDRGGLFVAPTHLLEPEVPVENVVAYLKACEDFK